MVELKYLKDGYKHDMGPTVITAPFLFQELFQLFDENLDDHLEFVPVSPWYRSVFHTGKEFNYKGTRRKWTRR